MKKFSIWHWALIAVAISVLSLLITGLIKSIAMKGIESADAAGWVQAFGSIAAIVGAFAIANREQVENHRRTLENERAKLGAVRTIVLHAVEQGETIRQLIENMPPLAFRTAIGLPIAALSEAHTALMAIPLHELGSPGRVRGVTGIQASLRKIIELIDAYAELSDTKAAEVHWKYRDDVKNACSLFEFYIKHFDANEVRSK